MTEDIATHAFVPPDHYGDPTCKTCGLPMSNRVHAPTHSTNSAALLHTKSQEARQAHDDMVAITRLHIANLVRESFPTARYVGINVTQGYDHGETWDVNTYDALYDTEGVRVPGSTEDDLPEDSEFDFDALNALFDTLREADHIEHNDRITYAYDLVEHKWLDNVTLTEEAMTTRVALDYAIFAINTLMEPQGSARLDVDNLERSASAVIHKLVQLRERL